MKVAGVEVLINSDEMFVQFYPADVMQYAESLGVIIEYINKRVKSVQQPCDLYATQQLKTILKDAYYEFRRTLDLSEQTKVKVPREIFVTWVECAFKQVHNAQRLRMDIRKIFQKCGLDPFDEDRTLFDKHLESLGQEALYKALTEAQRKVDL